MSEKALPSLKQIVKNNVCTIDRYRQGVIYYSVVVYGATYSFPVPVDDTGEATFSKVEKAILLMRYIRKALNEGSFVLTSSSYESELAAKIESHINTAIENDEYSDLPSWRMQVGTLLSYKDANYLLGLLKAELDRKGRGKDDSGESTPDNI